MARMAAQTLALGRVGFGVTALVAPSLPLRPWVGREIAWRPKAKLLGRALGGRDLALGIGVLLALRHDTPVRGWVEAGALADAGDVLATLCAFGTLPKKSRMMVLALAGGAVAMASLTAPAVDA